MPEIKHVDGLRQATGGSGDVPADFGVSNAGGDLGPVGVVGDAVAEPAGVVVEIVVEVGAVGLGAAGAAFGGGVGEDDKADEGADDEEHEEEVEPHEECVAVAGAAEAGEGDDEEGDADPDEGPLEELDAVGGVGAAAQPHAAADDGEGQEEGQEI